MKSEAKTSGTPGTESIEPFAIIAIILKLPGCNTHSGQELDWWGAAGYLNFGISEKFTNSGNNSNNFYRRVFT